ncbi:MAG: hypothetical protein QW767_03790 [Thermoprotei archaeon]
MVMRRLGNGSHVSAVTKRLIVRAHAVEDGKLYCVDSSGFVIGVVDEFFGSVSKPYAAVKCVNGVDPEKYVGKPLFYAAVSQPGKRRLKGGFRKRSGRLHANA